MILLNLMRRLTYGEIYVLTFPNGKKYVGQTTLNADLRLRSHLKTPPNRRCVVTLAIAKHGCPSLSVVERCCATPLELDNNESSWISRLGTADRKKGYNIALGGKRIPLTEVIGANMSKAHMGIRHTAESRAKIAAASSKQRHTEETKRLIGSYHRGTKHTDATRKKMSESHSKRDKSHSAETRRKISAANMGHSVSDTAKAKISAANKGRRRTPEQVEKMRLVALAVHARKRASHVLR